MSEKRTALRLRYGSSVAVLPGAVCGALERATAQDLRILILAAADPLLQVDFEGRLAQLCRNAKCSEAEVRASLAYWRGAGVLELDDAAEDAVAVPAATEAAVAPVAASEPVQPERKLYRAEELPKYNTEELSALLESRPGASEFLTACQQTLGKIFNTHEINVVMGLLDYLDLDEEYVLILMAHCAAAGKKTLHYIEKMAFGLVNDGVTDAAALTDRLTSVQRARELEGQIRTLFGMKERALTKKERGFLSEWAGTFGYGIEEIRLAYEETVNATGEASLAYANAILTRWNGENLRTADQIEAAQRSAREARDAGDSSFNTAEFFEAALQRSYNGEA
jgi:DnaD/phage-associated family protein